MRADTQPSVSVVNAGVLAHPVTGDEVVALVARGHTAKLENLSGHLPGLLRDIYHAAGGHHPDLDEYDRAMAAERRTAVLIRPERFTTNPPGTEHKETT